MKRRISLSWRIFLVAFLNVALLAAGAVLFARIQFGAEVESIVLAPAREAILAAARLVTLELENAGSAEISAVVDRAAGELGLGVVGALRDGTILAASRSLPPGLSSVLPDTVKARLRERDFPRGDRGAPGDFPTPGDFATPGDFPASPRPWPPGSPPPRRGPPGKEMQEGRRPERTIFLVRSQGPDLYWIGVREPVRRPGEPLLRTTVLLVSPSLSGYPFFAALAPWLWAGVGAFGVSLLCWAPLIRGITHTVRAMSAATGRIAEGRFDVQLPEDRSDELGELSTAINRMALQLSRFLHGQKRFLGDIAHELASPIARLQLSAEILEHKAGPALQGRVAALNQEIAQMSNLVGELLSFTKAGLKPESLEQVRVMLKPLVEEAVSREAAGDQWIEIAIGPELAVHAHYDSLSRSISNLIRNAIRYAGDAGPIAVSASRNNGTVTLRISDSGPGLPEEKLEQVFEPFYRIESDRSRASGGTGLGLAIVKTCVEACGGKVRCRNRKPAGLEVELELRASE